LHSAGKKFLIIRFLKKIEFDKVKFVFLIFKSLNYPAMKKKILILFLLFMAFCIRAQHIIDPNFAQAIRGYCPTCLDGNSNITEEGKKLTGLTVSIQQITDITGIIGFSSLRTFNCIHNNITFLPPLPNSLKTLFVSENKLTKLDNLPNSLTSLYCSYNQLTELTELPTSLLYLDCSYNALKTLDKLPIDLQTLACSYNFLTTLPSLPVNLSGLVCANNTLKSIPQLPKFMRLLSCQNNNDLTCLPKLPDSLAYLFISNGIKCLPNKVPNAVVNNYEGTEFQSINLPICSPIQLALCPPISPELMIFDKKISIYPNPTEGYIEIKNQGIAIDGFQIIDVLGQIVMQSHKPILDLTGLIAGWYMVRLQTSEGIILEKIIKQ
jgi:Secretion system C-terminal sorting domain